MHNSMLGPILPSGIFLGERFYRIFEAFYCMSLTGYSCHFQNCKNFWNRTSTSWVRTPWRSGPPVDPFWTPWCLPPAEKWAEIGRKLTKISPKSLKISHFYPHTDQTWPWYGLIWPLHLSTNHIPPVQAISMVIRALTALGEPQIKGF